MPGQPPNWHLTRLLKANWSRNGISGKEDGGALGHAPSFWWVFASALPTSHIHGVNQAFLCLLRVDEPVC